WYEARDVAAVTRLIHDRWPEQPKAAFGLSMGAAALCFGQEHTGPYRAFILEGVYHDLASAFRNRIGAGYPIWFNRFRSGIIWITEKRLGVTLAQLAPADYVAKLAPRPLLVLTGSDDLHAPVDETRRLAERCPGPTEFHVIPGAGHKNVDHVGGQAYADLILGFLDRALTGI
ncbi:MAG: lysophospholipase, partial [Gemmataceae bacterium]|nr:lysophospholipase [Gemmataceae bacterium]